MVPTQIKIGDYTRAEHNVPKDILVRALEGGLEVSTAPPDQAGFEWAYGQQAARGADEIVSVHISGRQSQTSEIASKAAATSEVPVHVVDSGTTAMSLGFAVLAAARVAGAGGGPRRVMDALARRLEGSSTMIYVDTLEYLRKGGRIGAAAALIGGALAMKPLLTIRGGQVAPLDRVMGAERAMRKLVDQAVRKADGRKVDIAIEHFEAPDRAERLASRVKAKMAGAREITFTEVSSTIGVHIGPGAVGITVSPT